MCCCIIPSVTGTFLNTLKFQVKDCDPTTGEPDSDVGYADEYVVSCNTEFYLFKIRYLIILTLPMLYF